MDILKFRVRGQALTLINPNVNLIPVTDTVNQYLCQFEFSEDWDDLNKVVVFKNVSYNISKEVYLSTSNECYIPWEVLSNSGEIFLEVIGTEVRGEVVTVRIPSTLLGFKWEIQEGLLDVSANISPTPDLFEQFVSSVRSDSIVAATARDEAVIARDVAVQSATDASASELAAISAAESAENSASTASSAASSASESALSVAGVADETKSYAEIASAKASDASTQAEIAAGAKEDAVTAKEAAESAKLSAQTFAGTAEGAASSALSSSNSAANSAQHAHVSEQNAEQASLDAHAAKQKIEHMTATVVSLEPGSDPTVEKTETALGFNLEFGIPDGNVLFATFDADVSTGHLIMYTDEHFSGADFEINNNGHMEVVI